jgi:hypothetical protein
MVDVGADEETRQETYMPGHVLNFVPIEIADIGPTATRPTAQGRDDVQFCLYSCDRVRSLGIDRGHHPVHKSSHRSQSGAMHQATLAGRFRPSVWECLFDRGPVRYKNSPNSCEVGFA